MSCSKLFFQLLPCLQRLKTCFVYFSILQTLGELGWIAGSSASGWIWVGMDRRMFSIWKWSGGKIGCKWYHRSWVLCKGPPWLQFAFVCFCPVMKYPISQDHTSRHNLNIFINCFFSELSLCKWKVPVIFRHQVLISPIRTWNFVPVAEASG